VWLEAGEAVSEVGLSFVKKLPLKSLPEGRLTLGFHLYSYITDTEIAAAKVVINVVLLENEWASEVVAFSTADPEHPITNILGINNTKR
jgi:hypothetical protein